MSGAVNADYDNGAFAIFAGSRRDGHGRQRPGAVTASGLQFAANGG